MPPRPPPPPSVLTLLCSFAAVIAVWLSVAVDQVMRGLVGSAAGVPFRGLEISAGSRWMVTALQGPTTSLGPWGWASMVLAGPVAALLLAIGLHVVVGVLRSSGWLRGISLAWIAVSLLWLPIALAAAALPGQGGPIGELYARLGEPQTGRWTSVVLGLVVLVAIGGVISRRAIAVGRAWMRADGLEFRRRLVQVTVGWPGAVAAAALAFGANWAPSAWSIVICVTVMGVLRMRTS